MAILVMDTATDTLGVGIGSLNGQMTSAVVQRIHRGHSRLLQPSIQFVLKSAGLTMKDIEVIGIGAGPGSYTGVRMAVATGKAMSHATSIPIVKIPTIEAMAQLAIPGLQSGWPSSDDLESSVHGHRGPIVLAMLHARRHRAFGGAFYYSRGLWRTYDEACVKAIAEWCDDDSVRESSHVAVLHDFPSTEQISINSEQTTVSFVKWSDVSSGFPAALLKVCVARLADAVSGDDVHDLLPDYALPVEAQTKIAGVKGVRES